jgi:hypothetical protein
MSRVNPFRRIASLAGPAAAVAAVVLLTPAAMPLAHAQAAQSIQQAAVSNALKSDSAKSDNAKSDGAKPAASQTTGAGNVAAVNQAGPATP